MKNSQFGECVILLNLLYLLTSILSITGYFSYYIHVYVCMIIWHHVFPCRYFRPEYKQDSWKRKYLESSSVITIRKGYWQALFIIHSTPMTLTDLRTPCINHKDLCRDIAFCFSYSLCCPLLQLLVKAQCICSAKNRTPPKVKLSLVNRLFHLSTSAVLPRSHVPVSSPPFLTLEQSNCVCSAFVFWNTCKHLAFCSDIQNHLYNTEFFLSSYLHIISFTILIVKALTISLLLQPYFSSMASVTFFPDVGDHAIQLCPKLH